MKRVTVLTCTNFQLQSFRPLLPLPVGHGTEVKLSYCLKWPIFLPRSHKSAFFTVLKQYGRVKEATIKYKSIFIILSCINFCVMCVPVKKLRWSQT